MSSQPHLPDSERRQPSRNVREFETKWLAEKLTEKWQQSKLSRSSWVKRLGLWAENGECHISYLLSGRRGMTFHKAVRIATAAGIDLAELQQLVRVRMENSREEKCLSSYISLRMRDES